MESLLANLPATRWDRLLAVLEESEPERAIDAPHILERAKKLHFSDLELFYLLLLRYQDKQPKILMEVVSLYAMMSTWMVWFLQVQRCMSAKKGRVDTSSFPHTTSRGTAAPSSPEMLDTGHTVHSYSSESISDIPASSHLTDCSKDYGGSCSSPSNSGPRSARNRAQSVVRGPRGKTVRGGHSTNHHRCFDLGPDWKWDGSLDFLRNGYVLSCLVEEALYHSGKFERLQNDYRAHPERLNPSTYAILYPSLADIDSVKKSPLRVDAIPDGDMACAFNALNYFSTFDQSELSRSLRGKAQVSQTLKMIEQQGKNLAAAEQWVRRLNDMCDHFLGWKKSAHNNRTFFEVCNPDNLLRPLNSDDTHLLFRMHWLAVALYRAVNDPSIIPPPPRMSFIVACDGQPDLLDTLEEDDEIGLLVATKCSCLPAKTLLSVTMKNLNTMRLSHPDMKHGPRSLPCTVVKSEVFAYFESYNAFIPVWSVLQFYIKYFDGLTWRFEMNRQEREQESQVLATNLAARRTNLNISNDWEAVGSCATFDLTMRSSTRHSRHRMSVEVQGNTELMNNSTTHHSRDSSSDRRALHSPFSGHLPTCLKAQTHPSVEHIAAGSKALEGHAPLSSSCPVPASVLSTLSPTLAPKSSTLVSPCAFPATGTGSANTNNVVSITAEGGFATNDAHESPLSNDTVSHSTKNPSSTPSLILLSRQFTDACTTGEKRSTPLMRSILVHDLIGVAPDDPGEDDTCSSREGVVSKAPKDHVAMECSPALGPSTNEGVLVTPSCVISCSPVSRVMVAREAHVHGVADTLSRNEETYSDTAASLICSESRKITRNFTASVVQESERNGIAIFSHRFRVSSGPIGKGAFGAVYKALNLDTGRIVAVKQSRYTYEDNTADLNWREFQMWSMLPPHANVITFYGASREVDTHQLLLVMEYASGGSIVQLYHNFRPIPEALFYDHALGIARGLKHLHDHNVIHGDVKPENVLTRSDGSVAISDFGCSRFSLVGASNESGTFSRSPSKGMSTTWQLSGTAAYMAPEVILNEPHLKSDVWAYACTLLQLWLGQSPWSSGEYRFSTLELIPLMFYIANEDVVPFTAEQVQRTPWWLQRIARRAFERDVKRRCTMTEVLSTLTECSRAYCS